MCAKCGMNREKRTEDTVISARDEERRFHSSGIPQMPFKEYHVQRCSGRSLKLNVWTELGAQSAILCKPGDLSSGPRTHD